MAGLHDKSNTVQERIPPKGDAFSMGPALVRRLPVLVAPRANSPYCKAVDTAYSSYRSQAWNRWPIAMSPAAAGKWTPCSKPVPPLPR